MQQKKRKTGRVRLKTVLVGVPVVAVCAIGPWLIPWHHAEDKADQPAAAVTQSAAPTQSSGSATPGTDPKASPSASDTSPTEEDVENLAKEVTDTAAGGYDLPVDASEVSSVRTVPGPYRKLGRIQIPSVGLDVSYGEGVFAKTLDKGPGHWPGTPMPGRQGNAVISGHRNTHTQPFKELDMLRPGDKIIIDETGGKSTTFKVFKTKIVPEAEYKDYVLRQPKDDSRQITLFACHPEGNPIFRIVVQARA